MIYASIDIETTGDDPALHQILQIGVAIEDTANLRPLSELPTLKINIDPGVIVGTPGALAMNQAILEEIDNSRKRLTTNTWVVSLQQAMKNVESFLRLNGALPPKPGGTPYLTCLGKNFGTFDLQFLKNAGDSIFTKARVYVIDPGQFCIDWASDINPPSMPSCFRRCGITHEVSHDALQDALDCIEIMRQCTNGYTTTLHPIR